MGRASLRSERPPVVGPEDDFGVTAADDLRVIPRGDEPARVLPEDYLSGVPALRAADPDAPVLVAHEGGRMEVTLRPEREAAEALYRSLGFEERPLRLIRPLRPG